MITVSRPTPTPKEVWKKISHIIRFGKRKKYNFTEITPIILADYVHKLEDTYNVDSDYIISLYVVPQWEATFDKLVRE